MKTATAADEATYVVRIDVNGEPFMRQYAEGATPDEALVAAQEHCTGSEVAAEAVALQPLLDGIIAKREAGGSFTVAFKHEGEGDDFVPLGPVWITDNDAAICERLAGKYPDADRVTAETLPDGERIFNVWASADADDPWLVFTRERAQEETGGARTIPFGSDPVDVTPLPWMSKADAKRLADYLGVELGEA